MPLNTQIDVNRPGPFTIRNHAFGNRPGMQAASRNPRNTGTQAATLAETQANTAAQASLKR